jgi:hypothetical protein
MNLMVLQLQLLRFYSLDFPHKLKFVTLNNNIVHHSLSPNRINSIFYRIYKHYKIYSKSNINSIIEFSSKSIFSTNILSITVS